MARTWFLLPDFTFTTDGPLRLGTVIPHWSRPTAVLATIGRDTTWEIELPDQTTLVEPYHAHTRSQLRSSGLSAWLKFWGLASISVGGDYGRSSKIYYGETDHEIHSFKDPLTPEVVTAIANVPAVRAHINSGMFGKRPVYVVSGLRIATSSFTVTKEKSSNFSVTVGASGPPPGTLLSEVGGEVRRESQSMVTNSYKTAPGIVFAYRLHVVRTRRARLETGLFTHKAAFLTGNAGEAAEPLSLAEATREEIDRDLEEDVEYETAEIGEDELCIYPSTK